MHVPGCHGVLPLVAQSFDCLRLTAAFSIRAASFHLFFLCSITLTSNLSGFHGKLFTNLKIFLKYFKNVFHVKNALIYTHHTFIFSRSIARLEHRLVSRVFIENLHWTNKTNFESFPLFAIPFSTCLAAPSYLNTSGSIVRVVNFWDKQQVLVALNVHWITGITIPRISFVVELRISFVDMHIWSIRIILLIISI